MTDQTCRPWWKKKRWAAVAAAWLVVGYPASAGPAGYFVERGWAPRAVVEGVYRPLEAALPSPPQRDALRSYVLWFRRLAARHADAPPVPTPQAWATTGA